MEDHHTLTTNAIGFCLLPSELMQKILLHLPLPEIRLLGSLNKSIRNMIADQNFVRDYNLQSSSTTWLFVYRKRWRHDAILCYSDQSTRWFNMVGLTRLLKRVIFPGESVYFLAADGNFFLFASNSRQEVIVVNSATKVVKKIPPSPLGPRGTSSWRRSGMKLVSGSDHFRFFFAELVDNRPVVFFYASETDNWRSLKAIETSGELPRVNRKDGNPIFLNAVNGPRESLVIALGSERDAPVILRPRFYTGQDNGQQLTVGFNWENVIDRLYVYGDGHMVMLKSNGVDGMDIGVRKLEGIELWSLSLNGRNWEFISKLPTKMMEGIRKPYQAMMGCLEVVNGGMIRIALLSTFENAWDIIWLSYDVGRSEWCQVPLPACWMKGVNMAGIAFSSGLTM
ncbi:hypothetical protein K2173_015566 [Erythroxylum novogranatense]|uniref:F-box domain-containing protein n=1 Tax=Erythroxylum novogranatense TaxID=1862640 RepID=A0AAV8SDW1_9ROSI|nr:hypothetical protein K2173_015566 [Erythroxylum novogranatense]